MQFGFVSKRSEVSKTWKENIVVVSFLDCLQLLTPNLFFTYRPTQNTEGNVIGFSDYATGWRARSSNRSTGKRFFSLLQNFYTGSEAHLTCGELFRGGGSKSAGAGS